MNSTVKFPAPYCRRRPSIVPFLQPLLRTWLLLLLVVTSLGVMGTTTAMPHQRQRQQQPQDFPIAAEDTHYVFRSDGSYSFSYDTGGGEHQSFRIETRDPTGRVSGRYGYIDPDGALRITHYQADSTGYRADMLIYRRVTSPPQEPLLVGPLPRRVEDDIPAGARENSAQGASAGPIGPVPFFEPDKPVLIIGPLPKPLQPPRGDDDFNPIDDSFSFDVPQGISLSQDAQQDRPVIRDVPQGPPPDSIPNSVLETILQDNFNRIFQATVPGGAFFNPSNNRDSQEESFSAFPSAGVDFSQVSNAEDLIRISQDILRGPEVTPPENDRGELQPPRPQRTNATRPNSTEERVERAPPPDILNLSVPAIPESPLFPNTKFDVFVKVEATSPSQNSPQESQYTTETSKINDTVTSTPKSSSDSDPSVFQNRPTRPRLPTDPIRSSTDASKSAAGVFVTPSRDRSNKSKVSKPGSQRASSAAVPSINLPPAPPPLTYLPADNTKIPMHLTFVGQLPDY